MAAHTHFRRDRSRAAPADASGPTLTPLFVSYASKDGPAVRVLARLLRGHGIEPVLHDEQLPAGMRGSLPGQLPMPSLANCVATIVSRPYRRAAGGAALVLTRLERARINQRYLSSLPLALAQDGPGIFKPAYDIEYKRRARFAEAIDALRECVARLVIPTTCEPWRQTGYGA